MFQISRLLKEIPIVNEKVYRMSTSYASSYIGFNSNFNENGEAWLIKTLASVFKNQKFVFVDGGANIGQWTKLVLKFHKDYEGHLFELMPETFNLLKANLEYVNNLHLNNLGISHRIEELYAKNFGDGHTCNTLVTELKNRRPHEEEIKVSCINLDTYCNDKKIDQIDLIKLDIEGYEYPGLLGARNLLAQKKINVIQFEYSSNNLERKEIIRDFYELLEPMGYKIGPLRPRGVLFQPYNTELNCSRSGPNFIACLPQYVDYLRKR